MGILVCPCGIDGNICPIHGPKKDNNKKEKENDK